LITESETRALSNRADAALAPPFLYRFPLGLLILASVLVVGVPFALVRRRLLDRGASPTSLFST
jgi:hypothetical protein